MTKAQLIQCFSTSPENDGALDGLRAGKLNLQGDVLWRGDWMEDGEIVAQWWDTNTILVTHDDRDAQRVISACDGAGVTVKLY